MKTKILLISSVFTILLVSGCSSTINTPDSKGLTQEKSTTTNHNFNVKGTSAWAG